MSDFVRVLSMTGLLPYIVASVIAVIAISLFHRFVGKA